MSNSTASVVAYVDDDFLLRQRGELNARRTSYREQVQRLSAAVGEQSDADEAPVGGEEGPDADAIGVERDRLLGLRAVAARRMDEIDAAVRRLDAGAYGACRSCRQPIPMARLETLPEATQCVACASGSVLRRR